MGIATVAVYSEADKDARMSNWPTRPVLLGPAPSRESYLSSRQGDRRLQANRRAGAAPGLRLPVGSPIAADAAAFKAEVEGSTPSEVVVLAPGESLEL